MQDEAGFLKAMQEHPEDNSLRLVFADWLEERGDARGELIRLLHTLTQSVEIPDRSKLENRLRGLVASGVQPVGPFWTNSIGMKFAWIPAGTFMMGSPKSEEGRGEDETQHQVTLSKGFAYSIGLFHTFRHPEIIIFGLAVKVLHAVINAIGEQVSKGSRFEHLDEAGEVLEGYNVCFRTVERKHYPEYLGYARWFYQGDDFPVLQCVWPDSQQRYPWHGNFSENLAGRQPLLSDEKSWPFQEGKNRAVFTTKPVIHDGHAILLVSHDTEGDWQFLCGTTNRPEDGMLVSLGSILQRDPSVGKLADLPEGWRAFRKSLNAPWNREQVEDGEQP